MLSHLGWFISKPFIYVVIKLSGKIRSNLHKVKSITYISLLYIFVLVVIKE